MAFGDVIGKILYRAEVDPTGVKAGAEAVEQEVRSSMNAIDRMRAEAEITADTKDLDRKILEAKKDLAALDSLTADPDLELDMAVFEAQVKAAKAQLRDLQNEKVEVQLEARQLKTLQRELVKSTNEYNRLASAEARATTAAKKEGVEIEKLRSKYSKLRAELAKLSALKPWGRSDVDVQRMREIGSELDLVGHRLRDLGDDFSDLDDDTERSARSMFRWGQSLASTRVHLGVISTTLGGFARGLFVLGPIITGVLGTLSALIGTGLEALVGGVGVASAAVASFGLVLGGLKVAVGEPTKAVTQAFKDLGNEYQKLTEPARQDFWSSMEVGLRQANNLLPMFSRNINETGQVIRTSLTDAFRDLGQSMDFRRAIDSMMDNANRALPGLIGGFERLAEAAANVFASFSRHFPRMSQDFQGWAGDLLRATQDTQSLNRWVDDLMDSLGGVGRFLQAAGGTIWSFFTSGSDQGLSLLDRMTAGLNDITNWIESSAGQASLSNFFSDAIGTAERLWGALKQIGEILVTFAEATRPFVDGLLDILTAVGDIANAMADIEVPFTDWNLAEVAGAALAAAAAFKVLRGAAAALGLTGLLGGLAGGAAGGSLLAGIGQAALRYAAPIVAGGLAVAGLVDAVKNGDDSVGVRFVEGLTNMRSASEELAPALENSSAKVREFVASGEEGQGVVDDVFGPATAARIQTVTSNLDGFGRKTKEAATELITMGKIGAKGVFNIATNIDSGSAKREIQGLVRDLAKLGQGSKAVKIIARADSVNEAIRKLQDLEGETKKDHKILIDAKSEGAINKLRAVAVASDKVATTKTVKVEEDGSDVVLNKLNEVESKKVGDKSFAINASIAQAQAAISTVLSLLASVQSKSVTVNTHYTTTGQRPGSGQEGGLVYGAGSSKRAPAYAQGGKIVKPQFLVGEEAPNHPEYVIATNPAYRAANLNYLMMAAQALGMRMFKKGGKNSNKKAGPPPKKQDKKPPKNKPPKSPAHSGLTSPSSKYDELRQRIDNNESIFGNMQRISDFALDQTGIRDPSILSLQEQKQLSIDYVADLMQHIRKVMLPALDHIIGTPAKAFRNVPKKAGKQPDKPHKPPSSAGEQRKAEYQEKLAKYERKMAEWRAEKERRKSVIQSNKQGIGDAKDSKATLEQELQDLATEKDSYRQDKIELGAPDPGPGQEGPTLAEQAATANQARYDLYRSMASNFSPITAAFGAGGSIPSSTITGALGASIGTAAGEAMGVASGSGAAAGAAPSGGGGTTINQVNNYSAPPPNPHTFSENLAYELGTVR